MIVTKALGRFKAVAQFYISDEAFAALKQVLEDVRAFERGERLGLKVTRIEGPRPTKASVKIQHEKRYPVLADGIPLNIRRRF